MGGVVWVGGVCLVVFGVGFGVELSWWAGFLFWLGGLGWVCFCDVCGGFWVLSWVFLC